MVRINTIKEYYMNYRKHYQKLIERARNRTKTGYIESHHIIPKCMGGDDSFENLVDLTPEEHYVAHQLLVKIYPNNTALIYAAAMMSAGRENNKMYGWIKRKWSAIISLEQTGENNSQYDTRWINDGKNNKKLKNNLPIPDGWFVGRHMSKRINHGDRICVCGKTFIAARRDSKFCSISCSSKSKPKHIHDEVAKAKMSERAKLRENNAKGSMWITDGIKNKRIKSIDQMPSGWHLGRTYAQVSTLSTKQE
jgi:hypothetical protein